MPPLPLHSRVIAAIFLLGAGLWISPSTLEAAGDGYTLPALPAQPVQTPRTPNTVPMGDPSTFPEVNMDFPIQSGPFQPTWSSIASNYPTTTPAWLRTAKFGMWVHYGPQASLASGDWSAQHMYQQGSTAYNNHLSNFGHPTVNGYKDVLRAWNPVDYNPASLAQLYYNAGARFLLVQGVHHDQFDNWNSTYNPWNAVNFGPKRDTMAEWAAAARSLGMRFGVAFHHEYGWWFYQPAYRADTSGTLAGVPYDAEQLMGSSGTGTWWQNYDVSRLYLTNLREYQGIDSPTNGYWNPTKGIFVNHLDYAHWYATQWALRIVDVIEQYDPDFIYTDGNSTGPFSGYATGTGYKCNAVERVIAHFYNEALVRHGTLDRMSFIKFHPPLNGVATTAEGVLPAGIKTDQPWLAETGVGNWFWAPGIAYDNGTKIVHWIMETASRDGAAVVNITPNGAGDLDSGAVTMLQNIGQWMAVNGAGIYGSRAWSVFRQGTGSSTSSDFRFTVGADGYLYAYCMTVPSPGKQLSLTLLGSGTNLLAGPIGSVTMLGGTNSLTWSQTSSALNITCPATMPNVAAGTGVGFKIGPPSSIGGVSPGGVAAQWGAGAINISWTYPWGAPAATFNVKRSESATGPFTTIATGLSGTNYADTTGTAGIAYYYTVSAVSGGLESVNAPAAIGSKPKSGALASWMTQDVGAVSQAGSFAQTSGTYTLTGCGADIWGSADAFRFAFQEVNGDCAVTARVVSMTNTAAWAKAGVMIRATLDAGSQQADAFMSPSNGFAFQQRGTAGGSSSGISNTTGLTTPYWVRLLRVGTTITAYYSANGNTWTKSGATTIPMGATVFAGLAACSVNTSSVLTAVFDNVSVTTGAYLKFDEGTGTSAADATGNGSDGTLHGGAAWGTGKFNAGLALSSTGQYVSLPSGVTAGMSDFTAAAWVNLGSATKGSRVFDFGTGTNSYMYLTAAGAANAVRFAITTSGSAGEQKIDGAGPLPTGAWCHVAVTEANGAGTLYVNGTAVGTNNAMTLNPANLGVTTNNYIGKSSYSADPYLSGTMDEFRVFNRALSATEVGALVSSPPPAPGGFTATAGERQAILGWNAASGLTGYNVKRSAVSGGPYAQVSFLSGTNYTDTGLVDGNTYYYVVTGMNGPMEGAATAEIAVTPAGAPANPPSGVAATNGNGQVTITWNPTSGATGYVVERAPTSGGAYAVVGTTQGGTFTDTGLSNGTSYYYVVSAMNPAGTSANYSGEAPALPTTPLSAAEANPPILSLDGTAGSSASLTTSGSVTGHNYQVQYSYDMVHWQNAATSSQTGNGGNLRFSANISPPAGGKIFFRISVTRP